MTVVVEQFANDLKRADIQDHLHFTSYTKRYTSSDKRTTHSVSYGFN